MIFEIWDVIIKISLQWSEICKTNQSVKTNNDKLELTSNEDIKRINPATSKNRNVFRKQYQIIRVHKTCLDAFWKPSKIYRTAGDDNYIKQ
jgi:hypothetical protein